MKLQCLVVDDEPIARDILESYISKIESLNLKTKCSNALEAIHIIHQEKIDIIFLDIQMPSLSGLEMLKTLDSKPYVILTTAFSEFGAESYEYGVTDYLLKPITFPRFLKAINKIILPHNLSPTLSPPPNANTYIFFKADKRIYKFSYSDILYFKGKGNYIQIFSSIEKPIMVLDKLSGLTNTLPQHIFTRVHKSYIVNIQHIQHLEGNRVSIENAEIPIGQMYKDNLLDLLHKN